MPACRSPAPRGSPSGRSTLPSAVAIDAAGDAWIANAGTSTVTELTSAAGANVTGSPFSGGGLSTPSSIAIDSSSSVWLTNRGRRNRQRALSSKGVALSPTRRLRPRRALPHRSQSPSIRANHHPGARLTCAKVGPDRFPVEDRFPCPRPDVCWGSAAAVRSAMSFGLSGCSSSSFRKFAVACDSGRTSCCCRLRPHRVQPIQAGSQASVAVTLTRSNTQDSQSPSATSTLPAGLSAAFTQPGTGSSGTVTFSATGTTAVAGTYPITLSGFHLHPFGFRLLLSGHDHGCSLPLRCRPPHPAWSCHRTAPRPARTLTVTHAYGNSGLDHGRPQPACQLEPPRNSHSPAPAPRAPLP